MLCDVALSRKEEVRETDEDGSGGLVGRIKAEEAGIMLYNTR